MATRGGIARLNGNGKFVGNYHHWDSYPEGLGRTLYHLYHEFFKRDLKAMLKYLIDDHPAGWSTINGADFSLPASNSLKNEPPRGPRCLCHDENGVFADSKPIRITYKNAARYGIKWVYAFDEEKKEMHILASYSNGKKMIGIFGIGDPNAEWKTVKIIKLDESEPKWSSLR